VAAEKDDEDDEEEETPLVVAEDDRIMEISGQLLSLSAELTSYQKGYHKTGARLEDIAKAVRSAGIKEKADEKEKQSAKAQQPSMHAFFGPKKKKK
jgi:hypothetical protein